MEEKWRLFLWAPRGPCHLASGTTVEWLCLLGTRVQTLATCWPFVPKLSQRPVVSLSPASHSGSRFLQEACLYHASQVLAHLILGPALLLFSLPSSWMYL